MKLKSTSASISRIDVLSWLAHVILSIIRLFINTRHPRFPQYSGITASAGAAVHASPSAVPSARNVALAPSGGIFQSMP